jgi:hypothetical protein
MLAVQVGSGAGCDEKLTAVGAWSGIGHRQETSLGVLHGEVLVGELRSVDGLASGAVPAGEVST